MSCQKILSLFLALLFLPLLCQSAAAIDWSNPEYVNKIVTDFKTPILTPGMEGDLSFRLTNPFAVEISNITVQATPYLLVYQDGTTQWDGLTHPPTMTDASTGSGVIKISRLTPNENVTLDWRIATDAGTPHGSWLDEPIYLVRLLVTFDDGKKNISYASLGFFSTDEWARLRSGQNLSVGGVDLSYLSTLGYDGIIAETSFVVKEEIPLWPLLTMIVVAVLFFVYGTYLYSKKRSETAKGVVFGLSKIKSGMKKLVGIIRKS